MRTLQKRQKAQILRNVLIVGISAFCIVKKEEEEEEIKRKKLRKCWVSPDLSERRSKGRFARSFEKMTKSPKLFFENFHMSAEDFNYLFNKLEPYLIPKRNTRPDAIPIKAKLAIVIEMLASGELQNHVGFSYRISKQHIGKIVDLVCDAICSALSSEFPKWNNENMLQWSEEFERRWNLPNCIGALDGKHLRIRAPPNNCSALPNYKGFNSIVFMAVSDASYRFTYIELGACKNEEDMDAFSQCKLGNSVLSGDLKFPANRMLNDVSTPYFMAGTDAFPLHERIMKPFTGRVLSAADRKFNGRLTEASHCVERAIAILCSRWNAVERTTLFKPQKAHRIVSACCALHNFMMRSSSVDFYAPHDKEPVSILIDLLPFRGRYENYPKLVRKSLSESVHAVSLEAATNQRQ